MKKKIAGIALFMVLLLPMVSVTPFAIAATPKEIELSIIAGLNWLAGQQNPDGSWGDYAYVGHTGLAVLKFEERARELRESPLDPEYEYYDQVRDGLDFLFMNAYPFAMGLYFQDLDTGDPLWHRTYSTGISLMAIAASGEPAATVGFLGSVVDGWTYEAVVQDTVDYLAFGQNDAGNGRGGWGYYENFGWSDNSNSGWVVLGLGYAQAFGATVPQFVKDELEIWIDYIQNDPGAADDGFESDPDGGSGYDAPDSWVNMLKTGNLLYQMSFVEYADDDQRVINAIEYQERHWNDLNWDPGWDDGVRPHMQAAYCMMKGFVEFGIETITVGAIDIDWFDEMSTRIVETQLADGSWPWDSWGDEILGTTWALLALEKAIPPRVSAEKDFRYTNVEFTPYLPGPDEILGTEDDILLPAELGDPLPKDNDNYLVDVVVHSKSGKVRSTNPGQLYGVITITSNVELYTVSVIDTFDEEFDVNPAHLGGGVEIIVVDGDGYATVLTDEPGIGCTVDNDGNQVTVDVDLDVAMGGPLEPGDALMIYIKFKTAMKHQEWGDPFDEYFMNEAIIEADGLTPDPQPSATILLSEK